MHPDDGTGMTRPDVVINTSRKFIHRICLINLIYEYMLTLYIQVTVIALIILLFCFLYKLLFGVSALIWILQTSRWSY